MVENRYSKNDRIVEISGGRGHSGGSAASTLVASVQVDQPRVRLETLWQERVMSGQPASGQGLALVRHAWRNISQSILTTGITVLTVATAVLLLTLILVLLQNLRGSLTGVREEYLVSIFLKESIPSEASVGSQSDDVQNLSAELNAHSEVSKVTFRSKQQALRDFRSQLGPRAGLLEGLDQKNPLPASLEVRLRPEMASEEQFAKLVTRYRGHPLVEEVQYSEHSLRQIGSALRLFENVALGLVLIGVLSSIFLIATTITLALYAHREEIEIMRLVGATHSRIRAPYLIEGIFEGLLGGALGLLCSGGVYSGIQGPLAQSEVLRGVVQNMDFIGPLTIITILSGAAIVGALGSVLAVHRFSRF